MTSYSVLDSSTMVERVCRFRGLPVDLAMDISQALESQPVAASVFCFMAMGSTREDTAEAIGVAPSVVEYIVWDQLIALVSLFPTGIEVQSAVVA